VSLIPEQPRGPVDVPAIVADIADGRRVEPVWINVVGGMTFQVGRGDAREFVKWTPKGNGIDLSAEAARLRWAGRFITVPRVLDEGGDEKGSWLVTAGIPGRSAVDEVWRRDPATAVRAIGAGLRVMHDRLPVSRCPFEWPVERRLDAARRRAAQGRTDPATWHRDLRGSGLRTVEQALEFLADPPPIDRLVVCHGDTCAPNTLIGDDGAYSGHVDLGTLGIADRWADLAVATWSTTWNYGPGWEAPLLDAYGIEPDEKRTAYYRVLWELS
jgi:aminoglycoside phosphotransferase